MSTSTIVQEKLKKLDWLMITCLIKYSFKVYWTKPKIK